MVEVPLGRATRLLNHGPVTVVTTARGGVANAAAVQWVMPASKSPPRLVARIGRGKRTWTFLLATGECVVNVPAAAQAPAVLWLGRVHGDDTPDKLARSGLRTAPSRVVASPRIEGAVAWLECRLVRPDLAEAEGLVLLEVVAADAADGAWLEEEGVLDVARVPTLHHLGGDRFVVDGEVRVVRPGPAGG